MPASHVHIDECWCCGREADRSVRGLCWRCYCRWQQKGFTGNGPGPEWSPAIEHALEYQHVITVLSARSAAEKIGVTSRTVQRWRKALRENVSAPG